MATYSSAPTESIIKYKYTHSNNHGSNSQNFIDDLSITVGANETYTLISAVTLNHSTTTSASVVGFMDTYKSGLSSFTEIVTDVYVESSLIASGDNVLSYADNATNLTGYSIPSAFNTGGTISSSGTYSELRGFESASINVVGSITSSGTAYAVCKATGRTWYEGMKLYLLSNVNYGTPATDEFAEIHLWFKKTVYNG